jgi:cell division protein FtsQ
MGKRKKKKASSTLTWKATKGFFRLLTKGILKGAPLFLFGAVGFLVFWAIRENLYADPGLQIQAIQVVPHGGLSEAKFKGLQEAYLGKNLLKLSLRDVAEFIELDPKILEARVSREFPKTLKIEIAERTPFAQFQLEGKGAYYATAEDGVVLDDGSGRDKNLLLVEVSDAPGSQPRKGKKFPLPGFEAGVKAAKAFRTHPFAQSESLERLRLDHLGNVSLVLKDGPELRLGRDPMGKLYMLESLVPLLKGAERKEIIYMELQYNDLVVKKK